MSIKEKEYQASYTVEAAFIFPIVVIIVLLLIYTAVWKYNAICVKTVGDVMLEEIVGKEERGLADTLKELSGEKAGGFADTTKESVGKEAEGTDVTQKNCEWLTATKIERKAILCTGVEVSLVKDGKEITFSGSAKTAGEISIAGRLGFTNNTETVCERTGKIRKKNVTVRIIKAAEEMGNLILKGFKE